MTRTTERPARPASDGPLARLHADERGMFTIVNCIAIAFCLVLMGLVINVGHVIHQKIQLQNTADAVAYSGALWQARGMNAITATNHVMGELLSFVVIHHAFGGKELDNRSVPGGEAGAKLARAERFLDQAWAQAAGVACTCAYSTVGADVRAGATILECKTNLKNWLGITYELKAAAACLPPPWNAVLLAALEVAEQKIRIEYEMLNAIESVAYSLRTLKAGVRDILLPAAKDYTRLVRQQVPVLAEATARTIAEPNGARGTLFGSLALDRGIARVPGTSYPVHLPLEIDPFGRALSPELARDRWIDGEPDYCNCPTEDAENMRRQIVKTTQLARATFPWVIYHRRPIMKALGPAAFLLAGQDPWGSGINPEDVLFGLRPGGAWKWVSEVYREHTAGKSIELCDELQMSDRHDLRLFMIKGCSSPDKGYERWTKDKVWADRLFTVIGLAQIDPPLVMGLPTFYRQAHPHGRLVYAQAMIYNGNRQIRPPHRIDLTCKRIVPEFQAVVGWDTLNWHVVSAADRVSELRDGGAEQTAYPKIRVNWKAKLVPGTDTRLRELTESSGLPDPFCTIVDNQLLDDGVPFSLRTH